MCKDCQEGINLIVPFLISDAKVGRNSISAIFIQVKNNVSFNETPRSTLFEQMDPFKLGFFDPGEEPNVPIIRMVFGLASDSSHVEVITAPPIERGSKNLVTSESKFTSYDIWCARASRETFRVITSDYVYQRLLKTTIGFPSIYFSPLKGRINEGAARRAQNPMAEPDQEHWNFTKMPMAELKKILQVHKS